MPGIHDLALFVSAALLLNVTPGADMLFVAGTAGARGRRAGVLAALGVGVGCVVHIALAALGLSALLAASELAFTAVKLAGAAYLVWMGLGLLRATPRAATPASDRDAGPLARSVFWQGALTNALNPKVALFFLAFLPQFVDASGPGRALAFVGLGVLFTVSGTLVNVGVALAAGSLAKGLAGRGGVGAWLQRAAGVLFVGLGLRLAFGGR